MAHCSDSPQSADTSRTSTGADTGSLTELTDAVRTHAHALGFDLCRIAPLESALHADFFYLWLSQGRAGEMTYLERHADKRRNPLLLTPKESAPFLSVIVLAVNYHQFELPPAIRDDPSRGVIASYAWSDDYHEIIRPLLYEIDAFIRNRSGRTTTGKCLVDTGPVLERDWAQRAGIGFTGKNCCTINPAAGSWLILATILVPERLRYDNPPRQYGSHTSTTPTPQSVASGLPCSGDYGSWHVPLETIGRHDSPSHRTGSCGKCTRCLDSCPTDSFVGPYHLDPQRCISYWTIEARQPIPRSLRPKFGNRIFGCDICQDICPWNQRLQPRIPLIEALRAHQYRLAPPLLEGFSSESPYWLTTDAFRDQFQFSPLLRPKRHAMLRNVCVALGNWASREALPALGLALQDSEPLVRGHAAWAIGRVASVHRSTEALRLLTEARNRETVEWVRAEIYDALVNYVS